MHKRILAAACLAGSALLVMILALPALSSPLGTWSHLADRASHFGHSGDGATAALAGLAAAPVSAAPPPAIDFLPVTGGTFTVDTTSDDPDDNVGDGLCHTAADECSLRAAIQEANFTPLTRDLVEFDIPGPVPYAITVGGPLPVITGPIRIDGQSEPDFAGVPVVAIDGAGTGGPGLHIQAGPSLVQFMMIYDFGGDGVLIDTEGGNVLQLNYIGVDTGDPASIFIGNGGDGVRIVGTVTNNLTANVISGNQGAGVRVSGSGATTNTVLGNFIGADHKNGKRPGNGEEGVVLDGAPRNEVIGNRVGGHPSHGILVMGAGAVSNTVQGNIVGSTVPDASDGSFGGDTPNDGDGIRIEDAAGTRVIGNTIGRNGDDGVEITGATARFNVLFGNAIGTELANQATPADLGNAGDGVRIDDDASDNCVGEEPGVRRCSGDGLGKGNIIAFNGDNGVTVVSGTRNAIRANSIHRNDGIGIDLDDDGPTANDDDDPDTGANNLQNYPRLLDIDLQCTASGATELVLTLDSPASGNDYILDFFANDPDSFTPPERVEAQTLVFTATVQAGTVMVTIPIAASGGPPSSVTATDKDGNSSEIGPIFSKNFVVNDAGDDASPNYIFSDSESAAGPTFAFQDISGTGTNVSAGDDSTHGPFALGFSIDFYGSSQGSAWLSSNGWLSFSSPPDSDPSNDCPLPDGLGADNLIAAVWDDLDASVAGAGVFYQAFGAGSCPYPGYAGACFIAQWNDVVHAGTADDLSFQIILLDDDTFLVQIADAGTELGSGSTTGLENSGATSAATYACDAAASIEDSLAIRFEPEDLGDAAPGDGICETMIGNATCTLRAAIDEANALRGRDTITFAIGFGTATIQPDASLSSPTYVIRDPVVISGHSQPPGLTIPPDPPDPLIILDGQYAITDAIRIEAGGTEINSLGIQRYEEDGIEIVSQGCNLIKNNVIGTPPRLGLGVGLGGSGIRVVDTISNTLQRNIIANNDGHGVVITGTMAMFNILDTNLIGLIGDLQDPDDRVPLGNGMHGVLIYEGSKNKIGDPDDDLRFTGNVIADNGDHGVLLTGTFAVSNIVFANYIGSSLRGDDPFGNTEDGVRVVDAAYSRIVGNTITANGGFGVAIDGAGAHSSTVSDNRIGLDFTGFPAFFPLGNGRDGVSVAGAPDGRFDSNIIGDNGGHGIVITGSLALDNEIENNKIGVNQNADASVPNEGDGIHIEDAGRTLIHGNTISGNGDALGTDGHGIAVSGAVSRTVIANNRIGTDGLGGMALPNRRSGVLLDGVSQNRIGGTDVLSRNIVSGNGTPGFPMDGYGIELRGAGATTNVIVNNVVGATGDLAMALGNRRSGIYLNGAPGNTIGGSAAISGNIVAGNLQHGIRIDGVGATGNLVGANRIGTEDENATTDLGNVQAGISIEAGASDNTIGAVGALAPDINVIFYNGLDGIRIVGSSLRNRILGNAIDLNDALGIDLDDNGPGAATANAGLDAPTLTLAESQGAPLPALTMVSGSIAGAGGPFRLELFHSPACDPSGFGEGRTFLDAVNGVAAGAFMLGVPVQAPVGSFLTATITDASGNTSEFSECVEVAEKPTPTPTSTSTQTTTPTPTLSPTPVPTLTPSATTTPLPPDPTVIVHPIHDAHVKSDSPNNNYGALTYLRLRAGTTSYRSFMQFNVTGITGSPWRAKLRIFVTDGSVDGGDLYLVADNWTETAITWNNAPALSGSPIVSLGNVGDNVWVEMDVSALVTGNGVYSFGMKNDSSNSFYFNSSEAATNPPELVVDYYAGPPDTPTITPTASNTPTPSATPTASTTPTASNTPTPSATPSRTPSPSTTPTPSATPTASRTPTASNTPAVTATPQVQVFAAVADAYVKSSSASSNYGGESYLRLRGGDPAYRSYLKFTVSGLSGTVQRATLRLYAYDGSDDGGDVHSVGSSWTESGITWSNAPAISGSPLDSVGSLANNAWAEYEVTAAVTGNGTFSFGLLNLSTNSLYFNSREAASFRPELVVETGGGPTAVPSATPPPSATPLPSSTPGPTATASRTPTPSATATASRTPTASNTPAVTATPQSVVFAAVADAYVKSSSANSNYGSQSYLRLRGGDPAYRSYLKFTVSGLSGTVQRATLRLYAYDGSDEGGDVHSVGSSWTESGITWSNAPAISGSPLDSVGSLANNTWAEYEVTAAVTGNGTFSFGLLNLSTNSLYFNSREAASFRPELVVETGGGLAGADLRGGR